MAILMLSNLAFVVSRIRILLLFPFVCTYGKTRIINKSAAAAKFFGSPVPLFFLQNNFPPFYPCVFLLVFFVCRHRFRS